MGGQLGAIDAAFRRNLVKLPFGPSRFYLNLTERCNLRCAHCITFAPEKTADGTGLEMPRAVLDALAPHLAHALYVGLTHAGEPTTAPLLEPLLDELRDRRAGAPYVVHVSTNGLALGPRRFVELSERGVSSWSFSIDGMSAATHDLLRIGSRIDPLVARLRELSAIRPTGVRLGISWTVTRSNLHELPALLDFAKSAGLDWVKLEEVAPVNELAAREAAIDPQLFESAIAAAKTRAAELQLPLLDHLRDVAVWKCQLDHNPEMATFSRLDDFANRMEINPCRFPDEVMCVEPNGDLKPVAFNRPPAGNILREDLLEIWNGPHFILERTRALLRRPCGRGPLTCPSDQGPAAW